MEKITDLIDEIVKDLPLEKVLLIGDLVNTYNHNLASEKLNKPIGKITSDDIEKAVADIKMCKKNW